MTEWYTFETQTRDASERSYYRFLWICETDLASPLLKAPHFSNRILSWPPVVVFVLSFNANVVLSIGIISGGGGLASPSNWTPKFESRSARNSLLLRLVPNHAE